MKLENLAKPLEDLSEEELLDRIRAIRSDRRVSKRAEKPLTKQKKSVEKTDKIALLLAGMTPEAREALLKTLRGDQDESAGN